MTSVGDFTPWSDTYQEKYRKAGYWLNKPLYDILDRQCQMRPEKIALIGGGRVLSFASLNAAVLKLAAELYYCGLRAGDKAVVQLPNQPEFYVAFWALLKLGVKPVFALFNHNSLELEAFTSQLRPKLLILSRQHRLFINDDYLNKSLKTIVPNAVVMFDDAFVWETPPQKSAVIDERTGDEVAFFQLSGGSTNTPKLAPRTHNDYYYSVRCSSDICDLNEETVYLCALPAPHNFPMSSPGALGVWYAGGTVVMAPDPSPQTCFPLIATHGVTMTALVPAMAMLWLDARRSKPDPLRSLQVVQVGGAKLSDSLARRIEPELGCRLQQVFGMAEGLVCYTSLDDDEWHRFNTQGIPISTDDEIKIVDEYDVPVADGLLGLLKTRGPYTIRGYYKAEEHNQRVFDAEGFYTTGDIVKRLPSGHIVVMGREKDQINRGGEKIAAEEVEDLLLRYPGIKHAAVVAIPDALLGEKSCAFLVCENHSLPKVFLLRKHLRECGVADFKLPDQFTAIPSLPLTAVGKPDKKRLRQMKWMEEENQNGNP